MKRALLPPAAILAAILLFSVWNSVRISAETGKWLELLEKADTLAVEADWAGTRQTLQACHEDWVSRKALLRMLSSHTTVDMAEACFRAAIAFAQIEDLPEFRGRIYDLAGQLRLLVRTEEFSLENIF